jgi:membrane-associated phospholipid phosphatase
LWLNLGIAYAFNNGTKYIFARARPDFSSVYVDPDSYSFPSGHAMISAAVYGLTAYLLSIAYPGYRIAFRIIAILLVLAVGISRMYLDAHWPSDVLAGFAAGWILVSLMVRWYER